MSDNARGVGPFYKNFKNFDHVFKIFNFSLFFSSQLQSNCSLRRKDLVKGGEGVLAAHLLIVLGALQCHLGALALVEGATWGHNDHVLGGNLGSLWREWRQPRLWH